MGEFQTNLLPVVTVYTNGMISGLNIHKVKHINEWKLILFHISL